jgi:aminoglycoside 2''-phosphotransferase
MTPGGRRDPEAGGVAEPSLPGRLDRRLPGPRAKRIDLLGEGDFCRAYLVDGHRVVRIPKHLDASEALEREACLMRRLAPRISLAVPRPTFHAGSGPRESGGTLSDPAEPPFSVHERIGGEPLTPEGWRALPPTARAQRARELGGFLGNLHGVEVDHGFSCGLPVLDGPGEARALVTEISETPGHVLPGQLREALMASLEGYLRGGPAWDFRPVILHADLSPGHVFLDEGAGEITGIIDWGDAAIGDPARDFIFLYEDWDNDFLVLALEGYDPANRETLLPRVHLQYLIDQLAWMLRAATLGREADCRHGIAALARGVRDFEESSART